MIIDSMILKKISIEVFLALWERMKNDFPPEEWVDLALVRRGFARGQIVAYSLSDKCVALVVERADVALLFYLWSDGACRSLGLGSEMLSRLKDEYRLVLGEVEVADDQSGNYQKQLSRIRFYRKNDFVFNDFAVLINGIKCCIISNIKLPAAEIADHMRYFYAITYDDPDQVIKFV